MKALLIFILVGLLIYALARLIFEFIAIRNTKVRDYKIELCDRCCEVCNNYILSIPNGCFGVEEEIYLYQLRRLWDSINSISYDKMLFQFWKPLKDEYWLTQEQIDFLNLKFEPHNTQK